MTSLEAEQRRETVPAPRGARRCSRWLLAALLVSWAMVVAPLALGDRTLFQRDVFAVHLHLKWVGAEALHQGRVPAINPQWSLGQPYRGNPNALAFYPGNLLYLVVPFWSAFNLHFALHWLLAFFSMRRLARELGQDELGALGAGITYAGCGFVLSGLTFYNILAVAAWWPLAMVGALRGGRSGVALGGLVVGLTLLCGEPIMVGLGIVPLAMIAMERHGWRRGALSAVAILALAALVALPQLVATGRILDFTVRGSGGLRATSEYVLQPVRLFELLMPLPFGVPIELGPWGFLRQRFGAREPFFYSLHFGVVGLWLALGMVRARPRLALLAMAGLLAALFGETTLAVMRSLTAGAFRYPEKFLFWLALAAPLLVGFGIDRAITERRPLRGASLVAAVAAVAAMTAPLWSAGALDWVSLGDASVTAAVGYWSRWWALALGVAAALLLLASWAVRRGAGAALVLLQLLGLCGLAPLLQTEPVDFYRAIPPFSRELVPGASVAMSTLDSAFGTERPAYRLPTLSRREWWRIGHLDLDYPTGIPLGFHYPFTTDFDSMISPLHSLLLERLPRLEWPERVRWMRIAGLDAVTLVGGEEIPGLRRVATSDRAGVSTSLYQVESPMPLAWWPDAVEVVPSQGATLERVSVLDDPARLVFAASPADHRPGGRVEARAVGSDVELDVESPGGGVVALRRSFQPFLVARTGDRALEVFPADVILTGIVVPPGRHRIVVGVEAGAELAAGAVAALAIVAALLVVARDAYRSRSKARSAT